MPQTKRNEQQHEQEQPAVTHGGQPSAHLYVALPRPRWTSAPESPSSKGVEGQEQTITPPRITKPGEQVTKRKMGRPATGRHPVLDVRVPENTQKAARELAHERGIAFSALVTGALQGVIDNQAVLPNFKPDIEQRLIQALQRTMRRTAPLSPPRAATITTHERQVTKRKVGRPATGHDPKLRVRVPENTQKAARELAHERGIAFSALVTGALQGVIDNQAVLPNFKPAPKNIERDLLRDLKRTIRAAIPIKSL